MGEDFQARAVHLRLELKLWEKQFSDANAGKNPSRDDIKKEPLIALKYKEYNRTRDILAGKVQPLFSPQLFKRKADVSHPSRTHSKLVSTPKKPKASAQTQLASPDSEKENTVPAAGRVFICPTPQKDGRVLGLFDLLSDPKGTPSKMAQPARTLLESHDLNAVQATPSRRIEKHMNGKKLRERAVLGTPSAAHKHSRTPQSPSKRYLLDSFVTPSKRRRLYDVTTPTSVKYVESATPAFLNRCRGVLVAVAEEADTALVSPLRPSKRPPPIAGRERRGLTRSLSSMIADMRRTEDARLDDEMDMLREMEDEGPAAKRARTDGRNVLVEDSQAANLLGPDGTHDYGDEEETADVGIGRDGQPFRVWKKRGQKRQTKRVLMRPRAKRRSVEPETVPEDSDSEDGAADQQNAELSAVSKTQQPNDVGSSESEDEHEDADYHADSGDEFTNRLTKNRKASSNNGKAAKVSGNETPATDKPKDGIIAKAVKKISSTANANFRRLKIRSSKGAKATSKGRFGRGKR